MEKNNIKLNKLSNWEIQGGLGKLGKLFKFDKSIKTNNKIKWIAICISALFAIYISFVIYFSNHFYFGSTINGIDVSGKSVAAADEAITSAIENYSLELEERGDSKEEIKASDIGLQYNSNGETQKIKDNQNPFAWLIGVFESKNSNLSDITTYDDEKLKSYLNKLACFDEKNIIAPQNPTFQYSDNEYSIVDEVLGNKVNKDVLYQNVSASISNMDKTINLDVEDCYEKPMYTKDSPEVLAAKETLDKYATTKITYNLGDRSEVLGGQALKDLLDISDNYVVTLNEEKVKKYVYTLADKYDTLGKTREFTTTAGTKASVAGGDYGWQIDKSAEVKDLIAEIQNGQTITKEPKYEQTAFSRNSNDIGNTYVEVNIGKQHLWFYKNGSLVVEGDIVTGNVANNTITDTGVYYLKYKEKDATLDGQNADGTKYSSPVSFWMPFNGGIGLHDASWRSVFGGSIYLTSGSHGCVNCPYSLASTIYNNIDEGTPIICYYD